MYLLNPLTTQSAQELFVAVERYRVAQNLVGARDGVNVTFTTPDFEKFEHNLPFVDVNLFLNGTRLALLDDYLVMESGGVGTGYDTIMLLTPPPRADDHLLADYLLRAAE